MMVIITTSRELKERMTCLRDHVGVSDALDVGSPRRSFILQSGERPVVLRVCDFASEFANSQSGLIPLYQQTTRHSQTRRSTLPRCVPRRTGNRWDCRRLSLRPIASMGTL